MLMKDDNDDQSQFSTGRTGFGQTPPLGVASLDDNSLFYNFFEEKKREHFKALVASPQKKTNDCLLKTPFLCKLGPCRPSAGGPRMDCRAVTNPGVVKI